MSEKQCFLVEGIVNDMALWLMQDYQITLKDALGIIYNSLSFEKLQNPATGLYIESSAYNYDILSNEMKNGCLVQEEA